MDFQPEAQRIVRSPHCCKEARNNPENHGCAERHGDIHLSARPGHERQLLLLQMLREARQHGGLGRMQPPQHSPGDEQHERRQWQPDCHPGHKGNWHTCLLGDQCGTDQVRRRADDCRHPASRGSIGQHQHQANSELSKLVRRSLTDRR